MGYILSPLRGWGCAPCGHADARPAIPGARSAKHQVLREVERAVAKRKPVVPLRIDKEPMRKDFEYFLASCHWLDVTDGGLENHLSGLIRIPSDSRAARHSHTPGAARAPALPRRAGDLTRREN